MSEIDKDDVGGLKKALDDWGKSGIMPIDPKGNNPYFGPLTDIKEPEGLIVPAQNLIEYAGDLLAMGKITSGEWFKLKSLVKTENSENLVLVRGILDAKSHDKESDERN